MRGLVITQPNNSIAKSDDACPTIASAAFIRTTAKTKRGINSLTRRTSFSIAGIVKRREGHGHIRQSEPRVFQRLRRTLVENAVLLRDSGYSE